jgi:hypothetical protein
MRITRANRKAVEYACLYFHYAKSVPVHLYAYNIYNDENEWCGCICFGIGSVKNMPQLLNCITGTVMELQRVALNGKQGHNKTSQAVSLAMRELKNDAVYLKCLFSYADTEQKHLGIIYQATNWIYIGKSQKTPKYFKNGKRVHELTVNDMKRRHKKTAKELGYTKMKGFSKYLYVMPYDKKLRKEILKKQKPYPKRDTE